MSPPEWEPKPSAASDASRFSARLRLLRKDRGLTQEQLAKAAGLERKTINRLERKRQNPSVATLARLCQALDCEIQDLLKS
jgi:transcriptional regulator with XRE-family HTH domain